MSTVPATWDPAILGPVSGLACCDFTQGLQPSSVSRNAGEDQPEDKRALGHTSLNPDFSSSEAGIGEDAEDPSHPQIHEV